MRIIIAGSREGFTITDVRYAMRKALDEWQWLPCGVTVVSGGARGVDTLGEIWAEERGLAVERFPAKWDEFGKSAGIRRNLAMAYVADALVALWDGRSKGTEHMISCASSKGLKVCVFGHNGQRLN